MEDELEYFKKQYSNHSNGSYEIKKKESKKE